MINCDRLFSSLDESIVRALFLEAPRRHGNSSSRKRQRSNNQGGKCCSEEVIELLIRCWRKILTILVNASGDEVNISASVKDSGGKRRENSVKIRIYRSSETSHIYIYSHFNPFLIPFLSYRNGPR